MYLKQVCYSILECIKSYFKPRIVLLVIDKDTYYDYIFAKDNELLSRCYDEIVSIHPYLYHISKDKYKLLDLYKNNKVVKLI